MMSGIRHFVCGFAETLVLGVAVASGQPPVNADAAQSATAQPLAFDVVSIRPYPKNDLMIRVRTLPDGLSVSGMPMHMILREALGVTNSQLLAEPDWVNTERYELDAKVAPDDAPRMMHVSNDDLWGLLLPVLEDRCKLKFHHETREMTVYLLVIAKGGLKVQPAQPPASVVPTAASGSAPPMPPPLTPSHPGEILFITHSSPMPSLVRMLSRTLGVPVVDKTGLTGKYEFKMEFAPDETVRANMSVGPGNGAPPPESDGPSIFTAVREQLGLKLETKKESVDVVVIDHMEPPTEN